MVLSLKKIGFVALLSVLGSFTMNAQNAPTAAAPKKAKTTKMSKKKMALKEHVCTGACTADKHAFVHGEKGHTCGASCAKM